MLLSTPSLIACADVTTVKVVSLADNQYCRHHCRQHCWQACWHWKEGKCPGRQRLLTPAGWAQDCLRSNQSFICAFCFENASWENHGKGALASLAIPCRLNMEQGKRSISTKSKRQHCINTRNTGKAALPAPCTPLPWDVRLLQAEVIRGVHSE